MVDDYLDLRDMVALRLASRDLFTRFILPKQVFESATIIDETLAPFLDANQYRKTSLIRLEIQGKLAVRLHGKMYKMFYCNACGTAHIEPYFMRSQLVESPYIRSCGLDQSGDWRYRSTLQSLRKELEDRKRRVWGILRGNRMTVKREFYVGIANHGLQMATSSDFGRGMELFLENAPLCRHARKYHGRKIQKLIQFAHCKAGRKTSTGFKHDVSSKTGRYRTFGTWRLCWRPYCRTCVRFKTIKRSPDYIVQCEIKRQMTVPKHVNSRRWRREILTQKLGSREILRRVPQGSGMDITGF
jgi:hypothetical protein